MIDRSEVTRLARNAAYADARNDRRRDVPACESRAEWWAAEKSYKLGIVDHRGVISINGETARMFKREYVRIYRSL